MTFRVYRFNERNDVEVELATGIATIADARLEVRTAVRGFLNNEYDDDRWELRWMPNRRTARFRQHGGSNRVITWHIEDE